MVPCIGAVIDPFVGGRCPCLQASELGSRGAGRCPAPVGGHDRGPVADHESASTDFDGDSRCSELLFLRVGWSGPISAEIGEVEVILNERV